MSVPRAQALSFALSLFSLGAFAADPSSSSSLRLTFGSCARHGAGENLWEKLAEEDADALILLGDTVYADGTPEGQRREYGRLSQNPFFQKLYAKTLVPTWDDHDYGPNDSGAEYLFKEESRKVMLDFFGRHLDASLGSQEGGIYYAKEWTLSSGALVRVIMMDDRWNKGQLIPNENITYIDSRPILGLGRYRPNLDPLATVIGAKQWEWLEHQLSKPADVVILGSSIQVVAGVTGWEGWALFPYDQYRLFELISRTHTEDRTEFIISGDIHRAEVNEIQLENMALVDITSSGFHGDGCVLPENPRWQAGFMGPNYGLITIEENPLRVRVELKDHRGQTRITRTFCQNMCK